MTEPAAARSWARGQADRGNSWQRLVQSLPLGALVCDTTGATLGGNSLALDLFGLSPESLRGHSLLTLLADAVPEDDRRRQEDPPLAHVLATGEPVRDLVVGLPRGNRWLLINGEPQRDARGRVSEMVWTFSDVSEQRWTKQTHGQPHDLLQTVAQALNLLLADEGDDSIPQALGLLGTALGVDHVYLYELHSDSASGQQLCCPRFLWYSAQARVDFPDSQAHRLPNIPFEQFPANCQRLAAGKLISGLTRGCSPEEQALLRPRHVLSHLVLPILIDGTLWGFIGFDDCRTERQWSEGGQSILRTLAASLGQTIQRRRLAQAQRESEARYRDLFENAHDIIYTHDFQGRIVSVNAAAVRVYGYTPEEAIGLDLRQIVAHEHLPVALANIRRKLEGQEPTEPYELLTYTKTGEPVWVEIDSRLLYDQGKPVGIQGVARDITERKWAEEALRDSERFARSALDALQEQIAILDHTGVVRAVNKAWRSFAVLAAPEGHQGLEGSNYLELCDTATGPTAEAAQQFAQGIRTVIAGQRAEFSLEYPLPDTPEPRWFLGHVTPFPGAGPTQVVIAHEEITKRKRAEAALQQANEQLQSRLDELRQRSRESTLLNELGDLIQVCQTLDEAYLVIAQQTQQLFATETGVLAVRNPSHNLVEVRAAWGDLTWGDLSTNESLFAPDQCWALRRGRVHLVENTQGGLVCQHLTPPLPASYVCVPMLAQGESLGILHVGQPGAGPLSEAKQRLAAMVADHIALALSNLKLRETLHSQSIRDPLTGLFNRRYLEESLEREVLRAVRKSQTLAVIMLDIDRFKDFNDSYGHDAGDTVLREVGWLLLGRVRGDNIACRYGGEEFMLILPDISPEKALQRAEELRLSLLYPPMPQDQPPAKEISVSLGVALFPEHGPDSETVRRAADLALYRAKAEGRNRVVMAP